MSESTVSAAQRLSERFAQLAELAKGEVVTLGELLGSLRERGHALLALFLVVPFLQPVPLPVVSTVFGLAIAVVGLQMALGRPPWLPGVLRRRVISSAAVHRICAAAQRLFRRCEALVRPRVRFLHTHPLMQRLVGVVLLLAGLQLALPLPIPASNFMPALAIALVALGSLEQDGLLVLLGFAAFVVATAFVTGLVVLPFFGVSAVAEWLAR